MTAWLVTTLALVAALAAGVLLGIRFTRHRVDAMRADRARWCRRAHVVAHELAVERARGRCA